MLKPTLIGISLLMTISTCFPTNHENQPLPIKIGIILGSTRNGRSSDKIAKRVKEIAKNTNTVTAELIDLKSMNIPWLNDTTAPSMRKKITNRSVQRWSKLIANFDAFIFVVPEYNGGYPGVLKNALDQLYTEWNGKPAGFIGYSGGPTGGKSAVNQLKTVTQVLQMTGVEQDVYIPSSWKAFDETGNLVDSTLNDHIHTLIESIARAVQAKTTQIQA